MQRKQSKQQSIKPVMAGKDNVLVMQVDDIRRHGLWWVIVTLIPNASTVIYND